MINEKLQDEKLKLFLREQVRSNLLKIGRKLVIDKGSEYLTARKLSEASATSVGSIYNQFSTMENFILIENMQTLDELYQIMKRLLPDSNPYVNLNRYVDTFSNFVINNPHLWQLLFSAHQNPKTSVFPFTYIRKIKRIEQLLENQVYLMLGHLHHNEKRLAGQVLTMSLFALSGFLIGGTWENLRQVNKQNICKLLLNTYMAGLNSLKKVK